jgi:hypothetical protein
MNRSKSAKIFVEIGDKSESYMMWTESQLRPKK